GEVGAGAPGPLRRRTAPAAHRTRRGPPAGGRSGAARGGIAGVVRRGSALLPPPLAGRGTRAVRADGSLLRLRGRVGVGGSSCVDPTAPSARPHRGLPPQAGEGVARYAPTDPSSACGERAEPPTSPAARPL